jgi:hypothetical protein
MAAIDKSKRKRQECIFMTLECQGIIFGIIFSFVQQIVLPVRK